MDILGIPLIWSLVLIETYWNVKVIVQRRYPVMRIVLIETYWNVKCATTGNKYVYQNRINRNILECKVCKSRTSL